MLGVVCWARNLGVTFTAEPFARRTDEMTWDLEVSDRGIGYRFLSSSRSVTEDTVKGGYGFVDAFFRSQDAFLPDVALFPRVCKGGISSPLPAEALAGLHLVLLPQVSSEALFAAIRAGDVAKVLLLIELGADVDEPLDEDGPTPVDMAQDLGHTEIIETLLEAGADPDGLEGM